MLLNSNLQVVCALRSDQMAATYTLSVAVACSLFVSN